MESKGEQSNESGMKEVNIDINGEPADSSNNVKSMSADLGQRSGLTKDELMKYANEPFWIRLRNILFATFWIVWVSILIAAVGYVVNSPGCQVASAMSTANAPLPANGTLQGGATTTTASG